MMTNGSMQESLTNRAILDTVEPDVFSLLAEYAYTGWYTDPGPSALWNTRISLAATDENDQGGYCCKACGTTISPSGRLKLFPNLTVSPPPEVSRCNRCATRVEASGKIALFPIHKTGQVELARLSEEYNSGISPIGVSCNCKNCRFTAARNGILKLQRNAQTDGNVQDEAAFLKRQYPANGMSHIELTNYFNQHFNLFKTFKKLSLHAKLFVLADMYLIEPLKALCLHRLHRDLRVTEPRGQAVPEFVDLLTYSYNNTSGSDVKNQPASGSDLRDLIMAYASANAKRLTKHSEFKSVLASGGDWTADFLDQVMKKI